MEQAQQLALPARRDYYEIRRKYWSTDVTIKLELYRSRDELLTTVGFIIETKICDVIKLRTLAIKKDSFGAWRKITAFGDTWRHLLYCLTYLQVCALPQYVGHYSWRNRLNP